jgi:hypothetical protein
MDKTRAILPLLDFRILTRAAAISWIRGPVDQQISNKRVKFLPVLAGRILAASLIAVVSVLALPAQQPGGAIDPPAGARIVLRAKGDGVQIYMCTGSQDGLKWVLKAPDALLLDDSGKTIGSHFAGPAWKLAHGSQVQGALIASNPAPEVNSVAWLLVGAKAGTATGKLADVKFIRRTETHGGVAPESGCQSTGDAGKTARIPYTATYTFYADK